MSRNLQALLDSLAHVPGPAILAVATDAAVAGHMPPTETLMDMGWLVANGAFAELAPAAIWSKLEEGLMGVRPSFMLAVLRSCGALPHILPEVAALAGCAQIGADGEGVDLAAHLERVLDLAATRQAPLRVRVAALFCNLGKVDSPPQHLPSHYRHIDRCLPRIEAIGQRFGLPSALVDFAELATRELERVHRATPMRADALTALLERVDAFAQVEGFEDLLTLCACDWGAYPGQLIRPYGKAALLRQALDACRRVDVEVANEDEADLHERRTLAVAAALGSCREE